MELFSNDSSIKYAPKATNDDKFRQVPSLKI